MDAQSAIKLAQSIAERRKSAAAVPPEKAAATTPEQPPAAVKKAYVTDEGEPLFTLDQALGVFSKVAKLVAPGGGQSADLRGRVRDLFNEALAPTPEGDQQ